MKRFLISTTLVVAAGCANTSETTTTLTASEASTDKVIEVAMLIEQDYNSPVEFRSIAWDDDTQRKLDNGLEVSDLHWPAVLDTETCTAALIGPQVVLTAAHCVDAADTNDIYAVRDANLNWFNSNISMQCTMNPAYAKAGVAKPGRTRNNEDHALCELSVPVTGFAVPVYEGFGELDLIFETVDMTDATTRVGTPITLAGRGCTDPVTQIVNDPNSPKSVCATDYWNANYSTYRELRIGHAEISFAQSDLVSADAESDEPKLCPGDSGGPLFSSHQPISPSPNAPIRRVIGVNSTISTVSIYGNPSSDRPTNCSFSSNFAPTNSSAFKAFAKEWLSARPNLSVCVEAPDSFDSDLEIPTPDKCR